jgi:hypothetical protein
MEKVVKCVLINVDTVLITEVEEIMAELGDPNCKLINPYRFYDKDNMKPWPGVTSQNEIMMRSENILTIADPTPEIVEKYLELTA